jgi:hypothetical protein
MSRYPKVLYSNIARADARSGICEALKGYEKTIRLEHMSPLHTINNPDPLC